MIYYSQKYGTFFIKGYNSEIPNDAILVSKEQHEHLLNEKSKGKIITVKNGKLVATEPEPEPVESQIVSIRKKRNKLLKDSDWTQMNDCPLSEEKRQEWIAYRQALRDITDTFKGNLNNIVWPTKPE